MAEGNRSRNKGERDIMNKVVQYFAERRGYVLAVVTSLCIAGWSVYRIACCINQSSTRLSANGTFHVDIIAYELIFVASWYALFFGTEVMKRGRKRKMCAGSLMES